MGESRIERLEYAVVIYLYYPTLLALLLLPIPILIFSLLGVRRRGRAALADETRRTRKAVESAICLNILCLPLPYLLFIGLGFLIIPAAMFGIAASVAGQAGRRPFLFGALACPWFPLPLMLHWGFVAFPTEAMKFAGPSLGEQGINRPAIVLLWLAWWAVGLAGAALAALILRSNAPPRAIP